MALNKSNTASSFMKLNEVLLPTNVPTFNTLPPLRKIVILAGAVKEPPAKSMSVCISHFLLALAALGLVKSVGDVGIKTLVFKLILSGIFLRNILVPSWEKPNELISSTIKSIFFILFILKLFI